MDDQLLRGAVMEVPEQGSVNASLGISRRTLLRRGAVVGGALAWSVPVVSTLAAPAAAAGTPAPGGISYVAILVQCADGKWYQMKWDVNGSLSLDYGPTFNTPPDGNLNPNNNPIENAPAPGVSASLNADGSITVNLGGCTLQHYLLKQAQCPLVMPGALNQPAAGSTGSVTFRPVVC